MRRRRRRTWIDADVNMRAAIMMRTRKTTNRNYAIPFEVWLIYTVYMGLYIVYMIYTYIYLKATPLPPAPRSLELED